MEEKPDNVIKRKAYIILGKVVCIAKSLTRLGWEGKKRIKENRFNVSVVDF